jgi:hypothetical protein
LKIDLVGARFEKEKKKCCMWGTLQTKIPFVNFREMLLKNKKLSSFSKINNNKKNYCSFTFKVVSLGANHCDVPSDCLDG